MIEVTNLSKNFGAIQAVSNITFSVAKGEILGFLGPNGAGKTTTMRILCGIFPPTTGTAKVAGFDVVKNPMAVRERIGYLPEQVPLYTDLTVSEYLDFVGSIWKQGKSRRKEVLQLCGLEEVEDALIKRLSRGYKQRVGLAQALIHDPEVLILDEPTVGLDPKQIREIRNLIKSFAGKKTVVLSTHILPEVSMTCQKVVIIHEGKVKAEGTPEALAQKLESDLEVELHVEGPQAEILSTLSKIPGVSKVTQNGTPSEGRFLLHLSSKEARPEIARAIAEKNWKLLEMRVHQLSLEDVFMKLVTKEKGA
jgi:ABC-2 type transport system ATP-binding protein